MEKLSREYLQLESELYQAVSERQLEVYFQPKFDLATRTISRQLRDAELVPHVLKALDKAGFAPRRLELTETSSSRHNVHG